MRVNKFTDEVSRRYAKALFDLAEDQKVTKHIATDIESLKYLRQESPEMEFVFSNPLLSDKKLELLIQKSFGTKIQPLLFTFLKFLIKKRKLHRFFSIAEAFLDIYHKHAGILDVQIISAKPLKKEQVESLTSKLKERFKKEISPRVSQDKSLIGGFRIKVGDQIYDYSVQTQLERFRQKVLVSRT